MNLKLNNRDDTGDKGLDSENCMSVIQDTQNATISWALSNIKELCLKAQSKNKMLKDEICTSGNESDKEDISVLEKVNMIR